MSRGTLSGQFLGSPGRKIFVLCREPEGGPVEGGSTLVVPPFGEEMNKSRRLLAETAQRLCGDGRAVLMPDLFGTGDSEGDFRDASVERWLEDLGLVCRHAEQRGTPVRDVLAVRLGCALAVDGARRGVIPAVRTSVWWQPVLDGRRYLVQLLRLRVAASGMRGGATETVDSLLKRSTSGETLEVAGYGLSPGLISGIEGLSIAMVPPEAGALHWFEFVREDGAVPLPTSRFVDRARTAGAEVLLHTLVGEPFWASAEVVRLPEVVEHTAGLLARTSAASPVPRTAVTRIHL